MKGILSLDGGGVRGIIEAVGIKELEAILGVPKLKDQFEIFAGTSTGALVAIALALGWTGNDILNLYLTHAKDVFPEGILPRIKYRVGQFFAGGGLSVPRYTGKGFDALLDKTFGEATLGDLEKKVVIVSYDVKLRSPVIFKSWNQPNLKLKDVARASASAPTYFPSYQMMTDEGPLELVDGGIIANNPSMVAIAESLRLGIPLNETVLVSLGTGTSLQSLNGDGTKTWGILQWVPHILESLMDGTSDIATYQAIQVLPDWHVFRFQLNVPKEHAKLDDSSLQNLLFLETLTKRHYRKPEVRLQLHQFREKLNGNTRIGA